MKTRKNMTWKVNRNYDRAKIPLPYVPDTPIKPNLKENIEGHLDTGNLFLTLQSLYVAVHLESQNYQYITSTRSALHIPPKTIAVYTGQIRVEEMSGKNVIRTPRHTFIVQGTRYLVTNLNNFLPLK